ncbi:MAG: hypothetical protein JWQ98_2438 [Chlorobi bacterium]|nr:hypothetical protein [Chlorobiota bacterium]
MNYRIASLALLLICSACRKEVARNDSSGLDSTRPPAAALDDPAMRKARFGDTISLGYGRSAVVEGDIIIRFARVEEDSRCPQGVQCITAGNARVALRLSINGGTESTITLNTLRGSRDTSVAGYHVSLLGIDPPRTPDLDQHHDRYVALVSVARTM